MKKSSLKTKFGLFVCIILSMVIAFPVTACKKKTAQNTPQATAKADFRGTHIMTAPDTDIDFIKNGTTEYALVVPADASSEVRNAKDEFAYLLSKAVDGLNIRVIPDTGLTHNDSQKYISLGETTLLKTSGIEVNKEALGYDGHRIVTKGNTVFLFGGGDTGTCYSVYTFMSIYFNFETYWADCVEIDSCFNAKLKAFDVTDIPDIDYRCYSGNYYYTFSTSSIPDEKNFSRRLRFEHRDEHYMMRIFRDTSNPTASNSAVFHNWFAYAPRWNDGEIGQNHPKWYSDNGGGTRQTDQFCYTAHGDKDEFEALAQVCAEKIEFSCTYYPPDEYPYTNVVTLSIGDNFNHCSCDACAEILAKTGTEAGAIIIFVNRVAELVDEWMNAPENAKYKRDNFKIIFFAYNGAEVAPVKWSQSEGKYVPVIPEVALRENVGVYCAPINTLDVQSSIYAESNDRGRETLRAWGDIADEIYYWTYSTDFSYYMYPFDSVSFYAEGFEFLAQYGSAKYIFNQQQSNQYGTAAAFHNYKSWLDSKLEWNVKADVEELTKKYFNAMYGDAADEMKSLYDEMRMHIIGLNEQNGWYTVRNVYNKVEANKDWWSAATVTSWLKKFETMYSSIEKYKDTDPQLYESLYLHISQEFLSPAYIMIRNQSNALMDTELARLVAKFKEACALTGITRNSEYSVMADFLKGL